MSVQLYTGSLSLVRKSGVGRAVEHQREMLRRSGIDVTIRPSPDARVVHCNTVFPDSLAAALWAKLRGKKVVFYGHSTMEDFRDSFRGSNFLAPLFQRWIMLCYNRGDVVITPTEYSRRLLTDYGVRRPVYALSNGVDTGFFAPSQERRRAFRARYGLREEDKVVMSVGHTIARKGLPEFVQLARSLPDVRFVEREELRDAYCGCDVFAFLSHEETEGIVVLEALACGIPVVLRDIPVYEGWLTHGVQVYKAGDDAQVLREVSGLLDGSLPSLAEAGLQTARSRSLEAMGALLRGIYEKEHLPYDTPAQLLPDQLARRQMAMLPGSRHRMG